MRRAAYSQRFSRVVHEPTAVVESHECPGCHWTFKYPELLAAHIEKCDLAQALALPKDNDVEGWTALAERMKRAAIEARARGLASEYEANLRRSEACAEKARLASEQNGAAHRG